MGGAFFCCARTIDKAKSARCDLLNSRLKCPDKNFGQHFLNSPVWQKRILEKLPDAPGDVWIEIGAGRGQMTQHLAHRAKRFVAIEADAPSPKICEINYAMIHCSSTHGHASE